MYKFFVLSKVQTKKNLAYYTISQVP